MLRKKSLQVFEGALYGTVENNESRMLVIQLMPGCKKEGEKVGKSNIVDYIHNQRGIEPYNLAPRRRTEETLKDENEEKK